MVIIMVENGINQFMIIYKPTWRVYKWWWHLMIIVRYVDWKQWDRTCEKKQNFLWHLKTVVSMVVFLVDNCNFGIHVNFTVCKKIIGAWSNRSNPHVSGIWHFLIWVVDDFDTHLGPGLPVKRVKSWWF
jgi:hypothetical protein